MNSVGPQCNELKKTYDACFQYWFSNQFLKGKTDDSMCKEQFQKYNECVRNAMKEQKIDMNPLNFDVLNTPNENKVPPKK